MSKKHVVMMNNTTYSRFIQKEYHAYTFMYRCRPTEENNLKALHKVKKLLLPSWSVLEPGYVIVDCFYPKISLFRQLASTNTAAGQLFISMLLSELIQPEQFCFHLNNYAFGNCALLYLTTEVLPTIQHLQYLPWYFLKAMVLAMRSTENTERGITFFVFGFVFFSFLNLLCMYSYAHT